ncbi:MAG: polysaccharide biosynthesis/export family protein, partial [Sphingomonadales bacterium]|nr:polysaccharide biosynthesis/export family protein [Sphingomonadales bacterium]
MAETPSQVPASSTPYRINPGDEIEVYVWGEERLQRKVKVLPDGTMAFPLVGQLAVTGMLPKELEAVISERLQPQYRGQVPQVTVSIVAP